TSSVTDRYVWDTNGKLTSVNVTLAPKTGDVDRAPAADAGYVHGSKIADPLRRHAYLIAHEFAHVEYAMTEEGGKSLRDDHIVSSWLQQRYKDLGMPKY